MNKNINYNLNQILFLIIFIINEMLDLNKSIANFLK